MWIEFFISLAVLGYVSGNRRPPHVILIMADDMGWNDVSFHGANQIPTPNIDALAYHGLILNQHYTAPMCSPSRASFLTGKYPFHLGMQHRVILAPSPWGLSRNETLLPELLNEVGYESHLIGKWHLGFHKKEYTPTYRGFKSHYGYWAGYHGYTDHKSSCMSFPCEGYDMRRNMEIDWTARGRYSTDVFTEEAVKLIAKHDASTPLFLFLSHLAPHAGTFERPLEAPDESIAKFSHIEDPKRRVYAAMVSKLDDSVGEVITALRRKKMLNNSIVIFMSDNGAPTEGLFHNKGSNYPLRGVKGTLFEGGTRVAAAVWSPLILKPQRVAHQLMHISDWVPTICSVAGVKLNTSELDGVDMWKSLSEDLSSAREEMVYNIDEISKSAALRHGDLKFTIGHREDALLSSDNFGWLGETGLAPFSYDAQTVFESPAGVALVGFSLEKLLYESDDPSEVVPLLLNSSKVLELRSKSLLNCGIEPAGPADCSDKEPCLFNLKEDPCEKNNIAKDHPESLSLLIEQLKQHKKSLVKARFLPEDEKADPILHGGAWSCWQDDPELPWWSYAFFLLSIAVIFYVYRDRKVPKPDKTE